MTINRPNQSPSSPRARVSNPWPIATAAKPLPEVPAYQYGSQMSGARDYAFQPDQQPSGGYGAFGSNNGRTAHTTGEVKQEMHPMDGQNHTQGSITAAGPTSFHDNMISPPSFTTSLSSAAPQSGEFVPSSNNPFRQRELTINTKAGPGAGNEYEASHGGAGSHQYSQPSQAAEENAMQGSRGGSKVPDVAPRLEWQDPRSPVDPSGFSGGYFTELQQLQHGIINADKPRKPEIDPREAEVAASAMKTNLQEPLPQIVDGPPLSIPSPQHLPKSTSSPSPSTIRDLTRPSSSSSGIKGMHAGARSPSDRRPQSSQRRTSPSPHSPFTTPSAIAYPPSSAKPPLPDRTPHTGGSARGSQSGSPKPRKTSEVYQIRQVNWYDAMSPTNPRRSPIMVQNENGPCPLLALVNALVLSTPSVLVTALVETLRVREQVTLGLLLDAVIEELMSERRSGSASDLPDVGDLYTFLVGLHSGMSVNPRFVPVRQQESNRDRPSGHASVSPTRRRLGAFEETRELKLYGTFGLPVIHGWIPPPTHPAFEVFARVAPTYEEAQNLLFLEEDLETKLKDGGLDPADQRQLEDIGRINHFLKTTATQLTEHGLESISECLAPGSLSILFRNDHFSTLYKHPRSGQLLTLVTDMGYAGHDEVVWESLVDVNGEGSEFYAGDFRPVGNVVESTEHTGVDDEGWETVTRRPRQHAQPHTASDNQASTAQPSETAPKTTEQEDHDLALAMHLQDEFDATLRQEQEARRRQDELSERYLSDSDPATGRRTFPGFGRGARGAPPTVPRRGGRGAPHSARQAPAVHRPASNSDDLPPPSYEQAAQGVPYYPPPDHPVHPTSSPQSLQRVGSAYTENAAQRNSGGLPHAAPLPNNALPALSRRPKGRSSWGPSFDGGGSGSGGGTRRSQTARESLAEGEGKKDKERECIVM